MKSIESRARIAGSALLDLLEGKLARVLNDCLKVTRKCSCEIHEGKVRAVHGGDQVTIHVLPMPELFEVASIYVAENYNQGHSKRPVQSFSSNGVPGEWKKRSSWIHTRSCCSSITQADNVLSALIRVQTSDVGVSGASIYSLSSAGEQRRSR